MAALIEAATSRGATGPGDETQRRMLASPRKSLRPGLVSRRSFVWAKSSSISYTAVLSSHLVWRMTKNQAVFPLARQ